jgi:hypothetical protein
MPKGIMFVASRPADPAREDEYNEWYSTTHVPEVCAVPGIVAARRYRVHDTGGLGAPDPSAPGYVAIYEIDSDDLAAPLTELAARSVDGRVNMSDAIQMDPPPVVAIYELID